MTDRGAPIALGPPSTSEGEPHEEDKQAIPQAAPEEVGGDTSEEVGQAGVVSVVVTEQESDDVGRGSDEQLVKVDEN